MNYKNKQIWFTQVGKRKTFAFTPKTKEAQPNFRSRLDRNTWVLFLDFDKLPEGFECWEGLELYLHSLGLGTLKTFSGKIKGLLLASGSSMSDGKAIDTIEKVVGRELTSMIDRQGILHSFVLPSQFGKLEAYINSASPVAIVEDRSQWTIKQFNLKQLPGLKATTSKAVEVLKFILSNYASTPVMDLPQKFIAEQCNMSLSSVNRAIKVLVDGGVLKVVDTHFLVGVKAKTYELVHASLRAVLAARGSLTTGNCFHREPPANIEDGTWFQTIWNCTWLFTSTVAFCNWIDSLAGISFKGRRKRALKSWEAHLLGQGGMA